MPDELTALLRALVATQTEIVDALADVSKDIRALEARLELGEAAAGRRSDVQPARGHARRRMSELRELPDMRDGAV